jgi:hypothetical protein
MRTKWLLLMAPVLWGCTESTNFDPRSSFRIPQNSTEVADLCVRISEHKSLNQEVFFPKPTAQCEWGTNGNVSYDPSTQFAMYEDVITARREQPVTLNVPDSAIICSASFAFAEQSMLFDDEIFLTFNDAVLASSFDYSDRLATADGLVMWDWERMKLSHYVQSDGEHPYCLGAANAAGACHIPKTQTTGAMSLAFSSELVHQLSAKAVNMHRYEFRFITTGDNNANSDCSHLDFRMNVTLDYIELPK